MAINWTWEKVTGLAVVQSAAHTALGLLGANELHWLSVDWEQLAAASGGAALVTLLAAVVAYHLPAGAATAAISASVSAAQDAAANVVTASSNIGDANEARGHPSTLA
jgi:hypothetical protein